MFSAYIEQAEKTFQDYVSEADSNFDRMNYDEAIANYVKAGKLNPSCAMVYYQCGVAYDLQMRIDEAIENYTKALAIDPKHANAYFNRGVAYDSKGKFDEAVSDYTKGLELDPESHALYFNRANAYFLQGKLNESITDYTKSLKLSPSFLASKNLKRAKQALRILRSLFLLNDAEERNALMIKEDPRFDAEIMQALLKRGAKLNELRSRFDLSFEQAQDYLAIVNYEVLLIIARGLSNNPLPMELILFSFSFVLGLDDASTQKIIAAKNQKIFSCASWGLLSIKPDAEKSALGEKEDCRQRVPRI